MGKYCRLGSLKALSLFCRIAGIYFSLSPSLHPFLLIFHSSALSPPSLLFSHTSFFSLFLWHWLRMFMGEAPRMRAMQHSSILVFKRFLNIYLVGMGKKQAYIKVLSRVCIAFIYLINWKWICFPVFLQFLLFSIVILLFKQPLRKYIKGFKLM